MAANKGLFITLEGGEGSGKSSQIHAIVAFMASKNYDIIITREPGGEANAEVIRQLVLNGSPKRWDPVSETLLFQAARICHINNLIKPSLDKGKTVISDRFTDSTIVYQGICKKLSIEWVERLFDLTLPQSIKPDLTILLDIDPEVGLSRAKMRGNDENRFESMGIAFHKQVREGFLALAKREPERIRVVDASQPIDVVSQKICSILSEYI